MTIRNARLVLPEGIIRGELAIEEGRIHQIAVSGLPKADREIDAKDKIVMPGTIDSHVHLFDPRHPSRGDFRSGSEAAAAGGVTSLIAMSLETSVSTSRAMKRVIEAGKEGSLIDFALHAGDMTAGSIKEVPKLALLGIKSLVASTCPPHRLDEEVLEKLMVAVKSVANIVFVHAEDNEVLRKRRERLLKGGRRDPLAHAEWRSNEAEEKAVSGVIELAKRTGCNLHLKHLTTREAVELVAKAKERRVHVTGETCPHYLLFTKDDMLKLGPYLKVNPALKTDEDREALWGALANGVIDTVASDHAPRAKDEKEVGLEDIWAAKTGVPGVETMLTLMLSEGVAKGRLTIERLVNVLCTRPAQIFGFYPRKGVIREGSDADLVLLDLSKEARLTAEKLHYKVGWTPYEGRLVKGIPVMTISRGVVVAEDGKVIGKPGHGQFLSSRAE